MSTDWGEQHRCQRCGQWKPVKDMEKNPDGTVSAFCETCAGKLEETGDPGGLGWLEKFRQKIKDRTTGVTQIGSKSAELPQGTLPRADSIPMSTEKSSTGSTGWGFPSYKAKKICKHRGDKVNGVPNLMGSSYRGGLALPSGGITVILTPEALADVQYVAGRGKSWASVEGLGFPTLPKPASDVIFWPWPDMQVPTDRPETGSVFEIADRLRLLHMEHMKGRTIEVACFGGHGRTGMLLAILAALASGWDAKEAVGKLRKAYCTEAVETRRQEAWVEKAIAAVRYLIASDSSLDSGALSVPQEKITFEPDADSGEDAVGQVASLLRNPTMGREEILSKLRTEVHLLSKAERDDLIREIYFQHTTITQVEIAGAAGLSPQRVSEIIKGK